jgi:hypothetical protein
MTIELTMVTLYPGKMRMGGRDERLEEVCIQHYVYDLHK